MRLIVWILASVPGLAGCGGVPSAHTAPPHDAQSSAWALQLHQPLTIPADAATVRLQYGRIVPRNGVQEHDPFCVVELDTVRDSPQTLMPGRFAIVRMTRSVSSLAAAPSPLRRVSLGDEGEPSFLYFVTEFQLRDPAQPRLRSMQCAWNQMAPGNRALMRHLSPDEMQSALGDWITIESVRGRR